MSKLPTNRTESDPVGTAPELAEINERHLERTTAIADKIFAAAQPGLVFSAPVTAGNYTVITASEVTSGGGFGSGSGFGRSEPRPDGAPVTDGATSTAPSVGGGGGLGGGGGAMGRPVAVIAIGPDGVTVTPIYDVSKVALAGLAAVGTIMAILARSGRFGRR